MRIIVDTSVWSLAIRRHTPSKHSEVKVLRRIIDQEEDIFLIGIILQEILQGVKKSEDFTRLKEHLSVFPLLEITREHYVRAAELKNCLSTKGIQVSTVDALIATAAIANNCYLFTNDKDFHHIAQHSKLRLLKPSEI